LKQKQNYGFQEYYNSKNACPSYDFVYHPGLGTISLSPTGHADNGSMDTEEEDVDYKFDFECEIKLDENVYLKFQKGSTSQGKIYTDKVCVKYSDKSYQCFNEWDDGVRLDDYTHISFHNEETIEYFKSKYLEECYNSDNPYCDLME